ncbi:hypothetical protein MTR67_051354 [Solanum verrucosum]|uniref:Tf2-1-like SH3-like domain-containing protein n=1 Tax=Solanum verrucosum TaxID=315347 RepID=A0AAF0V629_SOLVR|nr:hypothetical protein MTR67_051354 [Solanum verrucosum]
MDISFLMIHAQQIVEEKLKEISKEAKRTRIDDGDFSHSRCGRKNEGICLTSIGGCFGYGKSGHKIRSKDENVDHLRVVLQVLKDLQIIVKFSKCKFWLRFMSFLCHIISGKDIEVDSKKMDVGDIIVHNGSKSSFVSDVKAKQGLDPVLVEIKEAVHKNYVEALSQEGDGVLRYQVYEWNGMKNDITEFVAKCPNCHQVKVEQQKSGGPELVHRAMKNVRLSRERLKTTQSLQKSYADLRRRDHNFDVEHLIYLKISPMKGVKRFGKRGKLSPRYVGSYHILRRIGKVSYQLDFPNDLASVHTVFYISLLKKCVGDSKSFLPMEILGI